MFQVIEAEFQASASDPSTLPPPLSAEVAFAGKSNVGKSSLLNSLLQRNKLVRTSSTPGCTRTINTFGVVVQSEATKQRANLVFADLPGYGFAQRSRAERKSWGPLMERYLAERQGLALVVVIVDIRRGVQDEDRQLMDFLQHVRRPVLVVATKLDKVPKSKQAHTVAALRSELGSPILGYSSATHQGRDALWKRVLAEAHVAIE